MKNTIVQALSLLLFFGLAQARAEGPIRRHVLIVANNQSLDPLVRPLAYADDDGAKYYELFKANGAEVTLLTVLDPEAQRRYPEAQTAARPPLKAELESALESIFEQIKQDRSQGASTHFVFVYTGHGGLGPGREGYVNLLDERLTRSALYREVLAPSPAHFNHLILDACHAYFLVQKRGADDRSGNYREMIRDFLRSEELSSYPNTGVLLATSSTAEVHEWGRWEAGLFSHELRSALLGAADVDGDGRVTYAEAAACVEAANISVDDPKARLRVFYRSPPAQDNVALLELSGFGDRSTVQVEPRQAGHYFLEDARGVRLADFHPSKEQAVRIHLVGQAPIFVRTEDLEAVVEQGAGVVDLALTPFVPRVVNARGSAELSFRRFLYATPFGLGFLRGLTSALQQTPQLLEIDERVPNRPGRLRAWRWISFSTALATAVAGGTTLFLADNAHNHYREAQDLPDIHYWQGKTEDYQTASIVLFSSAGVLALTGGLLLWLEGRETENQENPAMGWTPVVVPGVNGLVLGLSGEF